MTSNNPPLLPLLKQYFGFDSFRPLQEEIIRDTLAGRDVFVLLPTGGGKSLCYQLPALVRPGLTVVVSPLIALMKDQEQALRTAGVPATFLNSSLDAAESRARLRGLHQGEYRLLYVAPERLMLDGFLETLKSWNVNCFAIDEAHCISEWGHDFRPEYRKLSELRSHFPETPIIALTATATGRVQTDIIRHLRLAEPAVYIASFNRPNLTYRVFPKENPDRQVLQFIKQHKGSSGIVYCQSRQTTENVAEYLNAQGVKARPYHAGLSADERSANQDLFIRDEIGVICATIAFGMGINKSNVRFVIHYDIPKNMEGYYQETGRAGRDGLASDCLLLFSAGDLVKQFYFIDQKPDPKERRAAREQLERMTRYAEVPHCRRRVLLEYFGEDFAAESCGACDNCLSPRSSYDGTEVAQKFLSCVYRIYEKSGFGVGAKHVIEVLTGAATEKIRRWQHDELSTYGIGKDTSRKAWAVIGRELVRLGLLRQLSEKFSILELTQEGRRVLTERQKIMLTEAFIPAPSLRAEQSNPASLESSTGSLRRSASRNDGADYDEILFERLRGVRKKLADERGVPAYMIFSDVSLRQMSRDYPKDSNAFLRVNGVGEKKLREFGPAFLAEIAVYLGENSRRDFSSRPPAERELPVRAGLNATQRETLRRFREGASVEEIAGARGLVTGTIYGHLTEAIEGGEDIDPDRFLTPEEQRQVSGAFSKIGFASLTGVHELLGGRFNFEILKIFRAIFLREKFNVVA